MKSSRVYQILLASLINLLKDEKKFGPFIYDSFKRKIRLVKKLLPLYANQF